MSLLCSKPPMTPLLTYSHGPYNEKWATCSLFSSSSTFTHSAPATSSFCCSRMPPGMSPPQGPGLGCSLCWEYSSSRKPYGQLPHLPWSFLKAHGSVKPLCPSLSSQTLLSHSSAWSTVHITVWHTYYSISTFLFIAIVCLPLPTHKHSRH